MVNDSLKTLKTSSRLETNPAMGIWAEEFEEIRSTFVEKPFSGNNKPNGYCDETNDIAYDSSGFKRELYLRKDYSVMDAYYLTPSWKKLRSFIVVGTFIYFTSPTIIKDTIPSTALLANSNMRD
uniref:MBD domain-containing protein n=1 Tax=Solanum lycopersicum TaxID=4081 RepID=A0A3Q7JLV3_SOLLC